MTEGASGRRYRQRGVPVFASMAMTWLPGVATNMTPSWTVGAASCPLIAPVENDHTGFSLATLAVVTSASGL